MIRPAPAIILVRALLTAACGSSSSSSTTSSSASTPTTTSPAAGSGTSAGKATVTLSTRTLPGLGAVLVNSQGRTLYVFAPDQAKRVTCNGPCASVWPPLTISSGQKPAASGGVKVSLISSDPDPSGGRVIAYSGWPSYVYAVDRAPGTALGQAITSSGGRWYVIAPSGQVVKVRAASGAAKSGSSSGGAGTTTSSGSNGRSYTY
jgi:predicted lipoprotein with Yx(FWY)xxD motif